MKKQVTRSMPHTPKIVYVIQDIEDQTDEASWEHEPYTVLQQKIEFLMSELGCSEREANRMVFGLLG